MTRQRSTTEYRIQAAKQTVANDHTLSRGDGAMDVGQSAKLVPYWGATRQAASMGHTSKVENGASGVYQHHKKIGTHAKENNGCQFWVKWTVLR